MTSEMTRDARPHRSRLRDLADTLREVAATPRGVAPDRGGLDRVLRREHT
jgi:hypothetical protein